MQSVFHDCVDGAESVAVLVQHPVSCDGREPGTDSTGFLLELSGSVYCQCFTARLYWTVNERAGCVRIPVKEHPPVVT